MKERQTIKQAILELSQLQAAFLQGAEQCYGVIQRLADLQPPVAPKRGPLSQAELNQVINRRKRIAQKKEHS